MKQLSSAQVSEANKLAIRIAAKLKSNPALVHELRSAGIHEFLKDSEKNLLEAMDVRPSPTLKRGALEFGNFLMRLSRDFPVLHNALELPRPSLTNDDLLLRRSAIDGAGIISHEGDIIGTGTYETLDPGWLLSGLHYLATKTGVTATAAFGTNPARIQFPSPAPLRIAVVGDWGTGVWNDEGLICPAMQVMARIASLEPDITIHLGDVYYSGTEIEEGDKFLDNWITPSKYNFSLNSNHEMYNGGNGYFKKLLLDDRFAFQQGTSYFSIETEGWIIFGLDSAYYDTSLLLRNGSLGTAIDPAQRRFIRAMGDSEKKIVVMTHHNGLELTGKAPPCALWNEVLDAFSPKVPDYWYWGHLHHGVVYSASPQIGSTRARCLGHGALPVSVAKDLVPNGKLIPTLEYLAMSRIPHANPDQETRIMNGFVLLTINDAKLREEYYNQIGEIEYST